MIINERIMKLEGVHENDCAFLSALDLVMGTKMIRLIHGCGDNMGRRIGEYLVGVEVKWNVVME